MGRKTPCICRSTATPETMQSTKRPVVRSHRTRKKTGKLHQATKGELRVYQCPPFFIQDVRRRPRSIPQRGAYNPGFPRHVRPAPRVVGRTYPQSFQDIRIEPVRSSRTWNILDATIPPFSSIRPTPSIRVPKCPLPRHN